MYEVYAVNHTRTTKFEERYLDDGLAVNTFITATKCVDCSYAYIIEATTGEIIADYDYKNGEIVWGN